MKLINIENVIDPKKYANMLEEHEQKTAERVLRMIKKHISSSYEFDNAKEEVARFFDMNPKFFDF